MILDSYADGGSKMIFQTKLNPFHCKARSHPRHPAIPQQEASGTWALHPSITSGAGPWAQNMSHPHCHCFHDTRSSFYLEMLSWETQLLLHPLTPRHLLHSYVGHCLELACQAAQTQPKIMWTSPKAENMAAMELISLHPSEGRKKGKKKKKSNSRDAFQRQCLPKVQNILHLQLNSDQNLSNMRKETTKQMHIWMFANSLPTSSAPNGLLYGLLASFLPTEGICRFLLSA